MATKVDPKIVIETSKAQTAFINAVLSGDYTYLLYGGAIRGGKSFVACMIVVLLAKVFPGSRWAIVRKDLPTLRRNTIPVLEKVSIEGFCGPLNRSEWTITCTNGSKIILFPESIKDDPDLDRWKGLEVNGFVLEEANELQEKSWFKAIERAGSWIVPAGEQPPPLILLTSNPAFGWLKTTFYDPWKTDTLKPPYYYQPATIFDNPYLPEAYLKSLENLPPNEYKRFVLGDWSVAAGLALHEWNDDVHVLREWKFPKVGWRVAAGMDWGIRNKSVIVLCASDSDQNVVVMKEWHWTEKDAYDAGFEWATALASSDLPWPEYIKIDAAMWNRVGMGDGRTPAEEFQQGIDDALEPHHIPCLPSQHGKGSRAQKLNLIKTMLGWGPYLADGTLPPTRQPRIRFVGPACPYLVSSLPALPYDPDDSEDIDTDADDHGYDALGAYLQAAIPRAERPPTAVPENEHPGYIPGTARRRSRLRSEAVEMEEALVELQARGLHVGGRYGLKPGGTV